LNFVGDYLPPDQFKFHQDSGTGSDITVACFAAGTRILTDRGELPVEHLLPGNLVLARVGDGQAALRPVVWIGHRRIDCRRHANQADAWPVRVRAGAFGARQPHRDLWLSPDHAVFAAGVLIPIRRLINAATVVQEPVASVTYWHVELARHHMILAEGLPCESYLDTGNRGAFSVTPGRVRPGPRDTARSDAPVHPGVAAAGSATAAP
jgi:hypothetical protein